MNLVSRLSIGANIVLMGIVGMLIWRDSRPALSPVAPPPQRASAQATEAKTNAKGEGPIPKFTGSNLTPPAVAQLENLGISRDTLINVLLEDLNRRTSKRLLELQKKYAPKLVPDREMRELARQNDEEQIRELKEAFGEDGYRAWDKEQTLHNLNRARLPGDELPMTDEEAERAYQLQKAFDDKNKDLQAAMEDGDADRLEGGLLLAQAQQTLDRELEKLLGKQRFDELKGNADPATEVYREYGDLNPTPEQAKAVLAAEQDYHDREAALAKQLKENPADATNISAALKALSDAQDDNMRRIFGAEAYDKIKQQNDPTYKTLKQYALAWELKDNEIQTVYQTLHALQDQADRARQAADMSEAAGQPVNRHDVEAAITQARLQTEVSLQNLIGSDRLQKLKQNDLLPTGE